MACGEPQLISKTEAGGCPPSFFSMNLTAIVCTALMTLAAVTAVRAEPVSPRMLLLDGTTVGADLIVVGERGTILRSTDQARTWQAAAVPAAATLTGVSFAAGTSHGWAVGHDALILATADAGLTWQKQWQGENLSDSFLDVLALDSRHVIAVGAYGLFLSTDDSGKTWVRRKIIEEDYHLNRLTRGPGGDLYLAGEHGTLLRSPDSGATWQRIDSPYDGSFYGILPLDAHRLVAYGLRGRIYYSNDDGDRWALVRNDERALLATAIKLPDGAVLFAGHTVAVSALSGMDASDHGITTRFAPITQEVSEFLELPNGSILTLGEAGAVVVSKP